MWEFIYKGNRYYWRRLITSQEIWDTCRINRNGGFIYQATIESKSPPENSGGIYDLSYLMKLKGE